MRQGRSLLVLLISVLCPEDVRERRHPARLSRRNCTHAAGRMPALPGASGFPGVRPL